MKIYEIIEKLQQLPENKKKIILWTIVVVLALPMGFFWVKGTINGFTKISSEVKKIQVPQIDMPKLPNISSVESDETVIKNLCAHNDVTDKKAIHRCSNAYEAVGLNPDIVDIGFGVYDLSGKFIGACGGMAGSNVCDLIKNCDKQDLCLADQTTGSKTYINSKYGFQLDYPIAATNILSEPKTSECYTGGKFNTSCDIFTSEVVKNREFLDDNSQKIQVETEGGLQITVVNKPIDNIAIHKYDNYTIGPSQPIDTTSTISIDGKKGYKYELVSSVNYKIRGYMIPLSDSSYVEIFENSKYPMIENSDWGKIISTFKFTK